LYCVWPGFLRAGLQRNRGSWEVGKGDRPRRTEGPRKV